METLFRITLLIAGIINFLPSLLVFFPDKISKSYGIAIPNANYELLLRHRAALFGIVGGLMIYSAIFKKNYDVATTIGLISMVSFILLFFIIGKEISLELKRVMIADVMATVILCVGYFLFKFK
ncbi:MAG: hypothetical protein MUF45_05105 [Spirosomaceae bacterium]|jgi:Ca2+/Na+ antiporter|nr:hypothetical protein [Spirosomataceae bacterium]